MGKKIQALFENDKLIGADVEARGGEVSLFIATLMASIPVKPRSKVLERLSKVQDIEDKEEYIQAFCECGQTKETDLLKELANMLNEFIKETEGNDNE